MRGVLLLAFTLAFASGASAQPEPMAQPMWMPGDHWVLHKDFTQPGTTARTTTVARLSYEGTSNFTFNGTPTPAHRVDALPLGAGQNGTTWYRASDFAKLHAQVGSVVYEQAEPCAEWQFPLSGGRSWNVTCTFTASQPEIGTFTLRANWTVEGAENVTTPAGTFESFVVLQERGDGSTRYWFAPRACHVVKQETMDAQGVVYERVELTSFRCASRAVMAAAPETATPENGTTTTTTTTVATADATTTTPDAAVATPPTPRTPLGAWVPLVAALAAALVLARRR